MMKLFRIFFLLVFVSLLLGGCFSSQKTTGNESEELDQNFAGYKNVVLIKRNYANKNGLNSIDRTVKQYFEKYYRGEFKLVTGPELGVYTDPEKYRFVITPGWYGQGTGVNSQVQTNIDMFDRKTGKTTKTKWWRGYDAWKTYIPLLESLRTSK